MFKNRVLQMRLVQPTTTATGFSEDTIDLNDIAVTTVKSAKTLMFNGAKLMVAWVVLDTARQIIVNKAT